MLQNAKSWTSLPRGQALTQKDPKMVVHIVGLVIPVWLTYKDKRLTHFAHNLGGPRISVISLELSWVKTQRRCLCPGGSKKLPTSNRMPDGKRLASHNPLWRCTFGYHSKTPSPPNSNPLGTRVLITVPGRMLSFRPQKVVSEVFFII